jgi:hypothetical protein
MHTCQATVEREVPRAWWDPAHHLLQVPAGCYVLAEGVRVQCAGDDARMVVVRCSGKSLKEQQEIRFERPPPCYDAVKEGGCVRYGSARTEEGKAGVVADD